jgi:ADP-ribose pyrophosphatase YjhB (NUDIX family)
MLPRSFKKPFIRRSVIGVIFDEQSEQVLAIKRRDVPIWVLPGGGVEPGETTEQAIARELFEETGLAVIVKRHTATYLPINRLAHPTYVYECTAEAGRLATGSETKELGFFPLNALPLPFFFLHRSWIKDAQKQLPFPIEKPLFEVTYSQLCRYFCKNPLQVIRLLLSRLGVPYNT